MMEYDSIAIGNRAYETRKSKNLKQKNISISLGIHQATYSKFELGQYDMHVSELIKLCELLDVSVSWIIGESIIPGLTDNECLVLENILRRNKGVRRK